MFMLGQGFGRPVLKTPVLKRVRVVDTVSQTTKFTT